MSSIFISEINPLICVESDDESENVGGFEAWKNNETVFAAELANESEFDTTLSASSFLLGTITYPSVNVMTSFQVCSIHEIRQQYKLLRSWNLLSDSSIELQKKFSMGNADIMQMSESDRHLSSLEDDISTVSCPYA